LKPLRLAYTELLPNERKENCAAFIDRAAARYAARAITVVRVLSDNAKAYNSQPWRDTCTRYFFAAATAGLVASTISAPLTALASEDAARLVLALSSNCPLCSSFSPLLFITTKRNFSPLLRISILPAIIVLSS
jgi:hypothetical protein